MLEAWCWPREKCASLFSEVRNIVERVLRDEDKGSHSKGEWKDEVLLGKAKPGSRPQSLKARLSGLSLCMTANDESVWGRKMTSQNTSLYSSGREDWRGRGWKQGGWHPSDTGLPIQLPHLGFPSLSPKSWVAVPFTWQLVLLSLSLHTAVR